MNMHQNSAGKDRKDPEPSKVRITTSLDEETRSSIKRIGRRVRLLPASRVSMAAPSNVNNIVMPMIKEGE